MASTMSQIGAVLTESGRPDEAVSHSLSALAMRLEMRLPQASIDLHWLRRQRAALGDERFAEFLRARLDRDSVASLLQLLERADSEDADNLRAAASPELAVDGLADSPRGQPTKAARVMDEARAPSLSLNLGLEVHVIRGEPCAVSEGLRPDRVIGMTRSVQPLSEPTSA
jgi:hypothetical protein